MPPEEYTVRQFSVHAEQVTPATVQEIEQWCGGRQVLEIDPLDNSRKFVALNVPTMEGVKRASEGEYVIRAQDGRFGVMSEQDFLQHFTRA